MDVGETKRPREVEKAVGVGGRVVTENAGQSQHPPIALQRKQSTGTRKLRRGRVQDCQVAVESVGRTSVDPSRIGEPNPHLLRPG